MTNSTNDTNATKTEFEDYELNQNISNWINSNYTESSENFENETFEIKQNEDNEKLNIVEEENNVKNQTVAEETKNDNLDPQSTSGKNLSKSLINKPLKNMYVLTIEFNIVIRVVELSSEGYKIRKIFA